VPEQTPWSRGAAIGVIVGVAIVFVLVLTLGGGPTGCQGSDPSRPATTTARN
jgi:hypothetical protein